MKKAILGTLRLCLPVRLASARMMQSITNAVHHSAIALVVGSPCQAGGSRSGVPTVNCTIGAAQKAESNA
jgi:hypothetical protein